MFSNTVAVSAQREYDADKIAYIIANHFVSLGIGASLFEGKKVVIKPNLVMKKSPDAAATTHPAMLEGLLKVLNGFGVKPTIAESPGGVYSAARLDGVYRGCGIDKPSEKYGAVLNYDVDAERVDFDGELVKSFNIIKPIADADVIIDICRLKSHSLTTMSAAVKNLFGTVPGIEKFEAHAAYPDYADFNRMLCDLCLMHCTKKSVIAITDAIVCMEGNGPTAGSPKEIGYILTSKNPFASDLLAERIIGFEGKVPSVEISRRRGLCPQSADELEILGDIPQTAENFAQPDTSGGGSVKALTFFSRGKIGRLFMPKPYATSDCRACGECVRSCPKKTITLQNGKARINVSNCIRCFCCQELCPFKAIKIKRNFITRLVGNIK
ncbi:MAG: DUF362 domain-containing protein [Clostridia bacterium]|nr:DUF362 domain-containing protein [Clostridia bacterium]